MSSKCAVLAPAPERFGFFIGERSLPTLGHRELPTHGAESGGAAFANGHQLRHWAPVPLDHDGLAIFHEVEQLRQLGLGTVHANVHVVSLVHCSD